MAGLINMILGKIIKRNYRYPKTRCFLVLAIVLPFFHIAGHVAYCSETYYINNNRVLLYKIINWWYYCLPEEENRFCGSHVKCQSKGNARVEYNEAKMILEIKIKGGFADLLSIFKQCGQCFGPSYLKCTWSDQKYLGGGEAEIVSNNMSSTSAFIINNIDKSHARRIQSIEKKIVIELEGTVGGLLNGQIALHQLGNFIKTCPAVSHGRDAGLPTSIKIIDSDANNVLAIYSMIMAH